MSVSILETLQNAEYNLRHRSNHLAFALAKDQMKNAIGLLLKGYSVNEQVEPLLEKYGQVEDVPDKDS